MTAQHPDYWTMQEAIEEITDQLDAVEQFQRRSPLLPRSVWPKVRD